MTLYFYFFISLNFSYRLVKPRCYHYHILTQWASLVLCFGSASPALAGRFGLSQPALTTHTAATAHPRRGPRLKTLPMGETQIAICSTLSHLLAKSLRTLSVMLKKLVLNGIPGNMLGSQDAILFALVKKAYWAARIKLYHQSWFFFSSYF